MHSPRCPNRRSPTVTSLPGPRATSLTARQRLPWNGRWRRLTLTASGRAGAFPAGTTAAPVRARFDLGSPASGPHPSDRFTVADDSQLTGRRVRLPFPDCAVRVSDCEDLRVLNTL